MGTLLYRRALAFAVLLSALSAGAFDLQGHRGARGLAPENTLPAFERALAIGVSTLELDVGVTADGVVVISHDPALNPALTRDASGRWLAGRGPRIKDLTLAQLQAYDVGRLDPGSTYSRGFPEQQPVDGTRIPTLAQLFARVRALGAGHVRFNVEIKTSPQAPEDTVSVEAMTDATLRVIREAGMRERVTVQSFDWRSLRRVQQEDPGIPTAYLTARTNAADDAGMPRKVKAAGGGTWSPHAGALTKPLLDEAHALGLQVIPWTVNDPELMETLVGWGVDGIITDRPDRLRAVLQRRGVALPPPVGTR